MSAHERLIIRLKRRVGLGFWCVGNTILRSLPAVPLKFPASEWQRRPPIPSASEIQEAAQAAFERRSTHPRPGEFVRQFNRIKQASAPMAQLPPPRQHTGAIAPVSRPLSVEFMPTMRAETPRDGMLRIQRAAEPGEREDHFLVVGPDLLFESVENIPTVSPLSRSDRAAMAASTDALFEMDGKRAELFNDVRQPSRPLEDNEPTALHERTIRDRKFKQAITGLLGKDEIA